MNFQRLEDSPYVPNALGEQPFPTWKRIDMLQDHLRSADQGVAASEGGTITMEDYQDALNAGGGLVPRFGFILGQKKPSHGGLFNRAANLGYRPAVKLSGTSIYFALKYSPNVLACLSIRWFDAAPVPNTPFI